MKSRRAALAGTFLVLALWPTGALGHGEKVKTDPKDGATVSQVPKTVSVTLTEPPTEEAQFTVVDGCGDTVSGDPTVHDDMLMTTISGGEPGNWEASYRVISSVDGHQTKDTFAFKVGGKKNCSGDEPKEPKKDTANGNPGGGTAQGPTDEETGSSFPIVPVAAGTVALVGLAFVIRTRAAS